MVIECEIDTSALISSPAYIHNEDEIRAVENYLAFPDQNDIPYFFGQDHLDACSTRPQPASCFFTVTVTSAHHVMLLPDCFFHDITVPDLIGRLQEYKCHVCEFKERHTICPGCTGGVAQQYGAFMGCGVDLAGRLCLGLKFMLED